MLRKHIIIIFFILSIALLSDLLIRVYNNSVEEIKVGIIDSGIVGSISYKTDDISIYKSNIQEDSTDLHGSQVVSIISGADCNIPIKQKNPNIMIYTFNIPKNLLSTTSITQGINEMITKRVDIINISLGTTIRDAELESAVKRAIRMGITIVASAGNMGTQDYNYPASYNIDGVISVGALGSDANILYVSNVNDKVDIYELGENVVSQFIVNNKCLSTVLNGTSASSAIVCSYIISLKNNYPNLSPQEIDKIMKEDSRVYTGYWRNEVKGIRKLF